MNAITPARPASYTASARARYMTLAAAFLGWMFDGMEMGIFSLIARPAFQEMQQAGTAAIDEGYIQFWMGIITAAFLLGAAGGGVIFGWLGDRIGRVRAMTFSILCYSMFTGLCYFAQEPWHIAVLRFVAALGMGGEWSLGVALVMEVWPSKFRPLMAGFIGAAANFGFVIVGVLGIIKPVTADSWRWMLIVGAAPAVLTFIVRLFVPESERWKEAVQGKNIKPLREIASGSLLRKTILATIFSSIPLIVTWGIVQWIPLWTDLLAGSDKPRAKAYSHLVIAATAILGCLVAPIIGQKTGRRPAYFLLCLGSIVSSVLLFQFNDSYNAMFLVSVALVGFFSASFYGWLPLYLPELFPTHVRATAQGLSFNAGRILAAICAWNQGAIMGYFDESYAKAGLTISLFYAVGMIVIWMAPETRGKPLPD